MPMNLPKSNKGVITGTIAQNDSAMMYWALLTLMSKNVYSPELTSDNQKAGVIVEPSIIYLPPNYVDASNLQYFLEADKTYAEEN